MNGFRPSASFVDDQPGLNFLNALLPSRHQKTAPLTTGIDLVTWLGEAGLVPWEELQRILAGGDDMDLELVVGQARALGDWFRTFVQAHRGQALPASVVTELEPLNRILEGDASFGQIDLQAGEGDAGALLTWQSRRSWRTSETLLLPIAQAMAELVCTEDFTHVRQCDGIGCTQLFVDRTHARARRWCSMAGCGNRAKQALHRRAANENR